VVIAIILILSGITFGISRGVRNAQARAQAKAELAVLAQAIEQFKARYGDYPWHKSGGGFPGGADDTNVMLTYALTGRLKLERDPNQGNEIKAVKVADELDDPEVISNPSFIDITKFETTGSDNVPEMILDPWGNPYKYWYKWDDAPGDWEVYGFHLYSLGPDGAEDNSRIEQAPRTGVMDDDYFDSPENADNIFSGQ